MEWDEERLARAVLTQVVDAGDPRLAPLLEREGAAAVLAGLRASPREDAWPRRAKAADEDAVVERARAGAMRFIVPGDAEWPAGVGDLAWCGLWQGMGGVPIGLWVVGPGDVAAMSARAVAIVGSRAATAYGERIGVDLASQLSVPSGGQPGWTIVSGGAFGVDAAAHRGTLAVQGATIGVYANGLDAPYPPHNAGLFDRLRAEQVVISEVAPGISPTRRGFLARNRLIAALSVGVVVVEAAYRSGAKNTAAWAGLLNRTVMAVPGPVQSAMSQGTHQLIRDGRASLVTDAGDIRTLVEPLGAVVEPTGLGETRVLDQLTQPQRAVHDAFPGRGTISAGELSLRSGLSMPACQAALMQLADLELVEVADCGTWRLRRPGRRPRARRASGPGQPQLVEDEAS